MTRSEPGFRAGGVEESGGANPAFRVQRGGQSTFEYAAMVVIVCAALLGMAIYLKRGLSGRLRVGADTVGGQYDPRATSSDLTLSVNSTTTTTSKLLVDQDVKGTPANVMEFKTDVNEQTNRTGTENVGAMGTDIWQ